MTTGQRPHAELAAGRDQFVVDLILSLVGPIPFGDLDRRAVPPKLFPSSYFGGKCGNTVGRTLALQLEAVRLRGLGMADSLRKPDTSERTRASRGGSA